MSGTAEIARICRVTGRVQGVFFRASTAAKAASLGLDGHAINRPDGSVEVVVSGDAEAVNTLCGWLSEGPRMARVEQVDCRPFDGDVAAGFRTA